MLITLLLHGFDLNIERYTFYWYQVLEWLILLNQMKKKILCMGAGWDCGLSVTYKNDYKHLPTAIVCIFNT